MEEGEGSSSAMVGEELEIVFFDVETSMPWGPGERRTLLEFGAILLCPRQLVEVARPFVTLVRPTDLGVVTEALERKGITRDALQYAPPFCDIADNIHDVLHGRIWAGHNIDLFDSKIIKEAFAEIGRSPPEPKWMIDTLPLLTQTFGRRAGNMKMANLADYFHLGPQIHRSLDDVRMNLDVLKCCSTVLFLEENFPEVLGGFLEPNDISLEFIQVSVSLSSCLDKRSITSSLRTNSHSYQFERSFCIRHNDSPLQLRCIGLRVHYGVHPNYQDSEGRPKLSIVVDLPENLRELLEFCDEITEITSQKFGSTSTWCHVIKEYGNRPTVRLNIPTTVSGNDATYPTEIYLKEASGNIRKKDFSKVDVAELEFLFLPGDMVDAFFSVELYDYKNAGIRLVAKKLVVHCR